MCQLFIGSDSEYWTPKTRSLRIDGMATSIRMEGFFWSVLQEIASRDGMSTNQLITKLHFEAIDAGHDLGNFTSFLRVCCARYLSLIADRELVRDGGAPLADLSVRDLLQREQARANQRHARYGAGTQPPKRLN